MNFNDRFQVQWSIVFRLQIWKPVVCNIQQLRMYKSIFLIHILKEQLGDILFISFVIASGETIIFYFEWIV
jgi:hypothetical protein